MKQERKSPPGRAGTPRYCGSQHAPRLLPVLLILLAMTACTTKSTESTKNGTGARPFTAESTEGAEKSQTAAAWKPMGEMRITAYCQCAKCCGRWSDGHFADGTSVEGCSLRAVAASAEIPLGSILYLDGIGPVIVRDRGGAIKGSKLDLYHETHSAALEWGVQERRVWVLKEGRKHG